MKLIAVPVSLRVDRERAVINATHHDYDAFYELNVDPEPTSGVD